MGQEKEPENERARKLRANVERACEKSKRQEETYEGNTDLFFSFRCLQRNLTNTRTSSLFSFTSISAWCTPAELTWRFMRVKCHVDLRRRRNQATACSYIRLRHWFVVWIWGQRKWRGKQMWTRERRGRGMWERNVKKSNVKYRAFLRYRQ